MLEVTKRVSRALGFGHSRLASGWCSFLRKGVAGADPCSRLTSVSQVAPAPLADGGRTLIHPEEAHCLCYHCRDLVSSPFVHGAQEEMGWASCARCVQGMVGTG